jgi:hypothetical protein
MTTRAETIAELGLPSVESICGRVEAALPKATLYSCTDDEEVSCTNPWDAVEEYVENYFHCEGREPADGPLSISIRAFVEGEPPWVDQVGEVDLTEAETWTWALTECCDEDLAEWVEAAKAWLASEKLEGAAPELAPAEAS